MSKLKLKESKLVKDAYYIPGRRNYSITRDGRVFRENPYENSFEELTYSLGSRGRYGGYPTVSGLGPLHIQLAKTFIPKVKRTGEDAGKPLVVNHIDGNKLNYDLSNLEWVTYSENITHAFKTGLRTDNHPLFVRDLMYGKEYSFYSLNEAGRQLDIDPSNIVFHMTNPKKNGFSRLCKGRYIFTKDKNNFPKYEERDIGEFTINFRRPVEVTDLNGNSRFFDNLTFAARVVSKEIKHQFGDTSIHQHKRIHGSDAPYRGYCFRTVESYWEYDKIKDLIIPDDHVRKKRPGPRIGIPIIVTNLHTGEESYYESSRVFAKKKGVKKGILQHSVYHNNGRWRNFHIKYLR